MFIAFSEVFNSLKMFEGRIRFCSVFDVIENLLEACIVGIVLYESYYTNRIIVFNLLESNLLSANLLLPKKQNQLAELLLRIAANIVVRTHNNIDNADFDAAAAHVDAAV